MRFVKPSAYQRATGCRPYPLFQAIHAGLVPSVRIPGIGRRIVTHSPRDPGRGSLSDATKKATAGGQPDGRVIRTGAVARPGPRRFPPTCLGDRSSELYPSV